MPTELHLHRLQAACQRSAKIIVCFIPTVSLPLVLLIFIMWKPEGIEALL